VIDRGQVGVVGLAYFLLGLMTGWSNAEKKEALDAAVSETVVD